MQLKRAGKCVHLYKTPPSFLLLFFIFFTSSFAALLRLLLIQTSIFYTGTINGCDVGPGSPLTSKSLSFSPSLCPSSSPHPPPLSPSSYRLHGSSSLIHHSGCSLASSSSSSFWSRPKWFTAFKPEPFLRVRRLCCGVCRCSVDACASPVMNHATGGALRRARLLYDCRRLRAALCITCQRGGWLRPRCCHGGSAPVSICCG